MERKPEHETAAGRFAFDGLERAIHEKARLGILSSLASRPAGLFFGELKELCALTDGNLNRHLKVLQEEGLVEVLKGETGRRPKTLCRITAEGRQRFLDYLAVLEQVVAEAGEAARQAEPAPPPAEFREGWSPA